jgi:hypothetical protein
MKEAKARNPDIKLFGLAWTVSFPRLVLAGGEAQTDAQRWG